MGKYKYEMENVKLFFDHCYNFLLVDVSIIQVTIIKKNYLKIREVIINLSNRPYASLTSSFHKLKLLFTLL